MEINLYLDSIDMIEFFFRHIEVRRNGNKTDYIYNPNYLSPDRFQPINVSFPNLDNSWQALIELGFGDFNSCPSAIVIAEKSKYWQKHYNAKIIEIAHDTIKYKIESSLDLRTINELKKEILILAPDTICLYKSENDMVKSIYSEKYFYLWWD